MFRKQIYSHGTFLLFFMKANPDQFFEIKNNTKLVYE
jgi:hypothetical protein